MAIPFLNNIDLSDNQLLNAKLQVTTTAPSAEAGQIYFNSTLNPSSDLTAKYYSNSTDLWVSLKEYSFPTGTYVAGIVAGTTPKPTITFDLNAADGTAVAGERYLTKTNKWAEISTIPGTYEWEIEGDSGGPQAVASGDVVVFEGGTNVSTVLVGTTLTINSTDQFVGTVTSITAGVGLTGGVITTSGTITLDYNGNSNYILANPNGTATPESDSSINFNLNLNDDVCVTELGAIPVGALTLVKTYIDESVTGLLQFIGGFDASNGDLDSPLTTNLYTNTALAVGDLYVVSTAGNFFGNAATPLTPGDSVIVQTAAAAGAAVEGDFIVVQSDTDLATLTTVGIGNVNAGTGISVAYATGTATVTNTETNTLNTATGTITAGSLSGTVTHAFGINTIVQTISSSGDTVFCDVTRTATTSVATIAVAEATDITILVQKIG